MKNQRLFFASMIAGGLAFGAAGCILGADPNMNSMLYGPQGGTTGGAGNGGPGGMSGTAGMSGPTGPVPGMALALFDSDINGFVLNNYMELPGSLNKDLGDGVSSSTPPMVSLDSTVGNPDPGSLEVTAPYTGANQYVDVQNTGMFGTSHPVNWKGGTLHMRIRCDEGTFAGVAQPYAITTGANKFGGSSTNFVKNANWQEFTVNLNSPIRADPGYDATQVVIFGVQLQQRRVGHQPGPGDVPHRQRFDHRSRRSADAGRVGHRRRRHGQLAAGAAARKVCPRAQQPRRRVPTQAASL